MMKIVIRELEIVQIKILRIAYETKQHIQTHVKIQPQNECIECECIK